ncbi:uncharacterized protein ACA1_151980 [Acanthamoeba castellanii str. Neff]|uniref:Uncharacterized protein n=1 Tax=Acanthamoeba castellanii (strain ATCC 30010 / Neff) TaxID=1257118 RepID=L8GFY6_ACACF|nr:uncharacterized protein ACA1_151980 [Acanthamoeba castellanii str. Neff]ELR11995.1 hypothetical protein ACA1_151980 [Acanthamoeba castellanii str. Neff]
MGEAAVREAAMGEAGVGEAAMGEAATAVREAAIGEAAMGETAAAVHEAALREATMREADVGEADAQGVSTRRPWGMRPSTVGEAAMQCGRGDWGRAVSKAAVHHPSLVVVRPFLYQFPHRNLGW